MVFQKRFNQNALFIELKAKGFEVEVHRKIKVYYKGHEVGYYIADIIVNDILILELKACENITKEFEYQLLNYLKGTKCEIGLLLNFGKKPEFIRKLFHNHQKK